MNRTPEGLPPMPNAPNGLKKCSLRDRDAIQRKIGAFMAEYGDMPAEEIPGAIAHPEQWTLWCDQNEQIAAAMRVDKSDWYLCTLKNAAVREDQRGKHYGSMMYRATAERALASPNCSVLAADVTFDNVYSIRALESAGFQKVNRYCWGPGEKPADILQYVRVPAQGDHCPR